MHHARFLGWGLFGHSRARFLGWGLFGHSKLDLELYNLAALLPQEWIFGLAV